jgi:hypothetical protein
MNTQTNELDKDLVAVALYVARVRKILPDEAREIEQALYFTMQDLYPESLIAYILELTENQVYQ